MADLTESEQRQLERCLQEMENDDTTQEEMEDEWCQIQMEAEYWSLVN